MEGRGEAVVAILGSLNKGLLVTVLNTQRYLHGKRPYSNLESTGWQACAHKSLSAEPNPDLNARKMNKEVQISDGRYASSYQLAHCRVAPTSPPLPLTEFPIQRSKPSLNQGNFKIAAAEAYPRVSHTRIQGDTKCRKISVTLCNMTSPCNNAFANSLRQYPRPPGRSVSNEMLEKLLKRAQAEYSSNSTRMKRNRYIYNESTTDQIINKYIDAKLLAILEKRRKNANRRKHWNTLRGKDEEHKSGYEINHHNKQPRSGNIKKNAQVHSSIDSKNIGCKESSLGTTYDYLKAYTPYSENEERQIRLAEFGRQIRKTIKMMRNQYRTVFQVCPKIQRRYNEHKKHCCVKSPGAMSTAESKLSLVSNGRHCTKTIQCNWDADLDTNKIKSRDSICQCCPNTNDKFTEPQRNCRCKSLDAKNLCQCGPPIDAEYYLNKIDEVIAEWLINIPISSNENSKDKIQRETMASNLSDTLRQLYNNDKFEDNAKKAIAKFVTDVPMWSPGNYNDKELIRKVLVEDLLREITRLKEPDELRGRVRIFVDYMNFRDQYINKPELIDNLVNELKRYENYALDSKNELVDILVTNVSAILEDLPIKFCCNKKLELNTLAKRLVNDVILLLKDNHNSTREAHVKDIIKEHISKRLVEVEESIDITLDSNEIVRISNDLALKLEVLQNQSINGRDEMKNYINNALQKLNIPENIFQELTEVLLDDITYTLYIEMRRNFDQIYQSQLTKVLSIWLKNIPRGHELCTREVYSLIKDLSENIEQARGVGNEDYPAVIFKTITRSGIDINPKLIAKQIDELANHLRALPKKVLMNDLKEKLERGIGDVLCSLQISKSEIIFLEEAFHDTIDKNIDAYTLKTNQDAEHTKELLLEKMDNIIDKTQLHINIKNDLIDKLYDTLNKNIDQVSSHTNKHDVIYKVLREINYIIENESIIEAEKNDLKYKLRYMINENFAKPYNNFVQDDINYNIDNILNEAEIDEDTKYNLINKCIKTARTHIDKLNNETIMDYTRINLLKDLNYQIDKTIYPADIKVKLKTVLNNLVYENLNQPFSSHVINIIIDNIDHVIEKLLLPESTKEDLRNKLKNIVHENLCVLFDQTPLDYVKENLIKDVNNLFNDISLPMEQNMQLKDSLGQTIVEFLEQPHTNVLRDKLNTTVNHTITNSELEIDAKIELTNKLSNIINKQLNLLTTQTSEGNTKDMILKSIMCVLDKTSLPTNELDSLKNKFEYAIDQCFRQHLLSDARNTMQEEMNNIIRQIKFSPDERNDLINRVTDILNVNFSDTLDDNGSKLNMHDVYSDADATPISFQHRDKFNLKLERVDYPLQNEELYEAKNILQENEEEKMTLPETSKMSVHQFKDNIITHESTINDIMKAIDELHVPSNTKKWLHDKSKVILIMNLNKTNNLRKILEDIYKTVECIHLTWNEEKALKYKLEYILIPNLSKSQNKLRNVLINDIENAIDQESLSIKRESLLKYKIKNVLTSFNDFICSKTKNRIIHGINNVIDEIVCVKEKKNRLKNNIANIVHTLSTVMEDGDILKGKIIYHANKIIEAALVRSQIKEFLKSELQNVFNKNLNQPFGIDNLIATKGAMFKIIDELFITDYQKNELKRNLIDMLINKLDLNIDPIIGKVFTAINRLIEEEALSKVKKSEIKNKFRKIFESSLNEPSLYEKNKLKQALHEVIDNALIPIHTKPNLKNKLENTLTKCFEAAPSHFINKTLDLEVGEPATSTPNKSRKTWEQPSVSLSTIPDNDFIQSLSPEENYYWTRIVDVMRRWIDSQSIHLNDEIKEDIIRGLISDIGDRQNYLQMNPAARKTIQDELDNLQYQLFRKLNKVVNNSDMNVIIQTTDDLTKSLQNITASMQAGPDNSVNKSRDSATICDNNGMIRPKPALSQALHQDSLHGVLFNSRNEAEKYDSLSTSISTPKKSKSSTVMEDKIKTAILKDLNDIIRDMNLPENKKTDLTNGLAEVIKVQVGKIFSDLKKDPNAHKKTMERNMNRIINQTLIPKNVKNNIKSRIMQTVNKNIGSTLDSAANKPATSIPKKSRKHSENDFSFLSAKENEYWMQIIDATGKWIDSQSIPLDDEIKKMIKTGLLIDIRDRQKYLQINPVAKKTLQEELENLKYELFRKLDKVLGNSDSSVIIQTTDDLMKCMHGVEVPKILQDKKNPVSEAKSRNSGMKYDNDVTINSTPTYPQALPQNSLDGVTFNTSKVAKEKQNPVSEAKSRNSPKKYSNDVTIKSTPTYPQALPQNSLDGVTFNTSKVAKGKNLAQVESPTVNRPVTSTPKKSRKTWEQGSVNLSTIPDNNFIPFLNPEENEYWMQIVDAMERWIESLSLDLDDETKKRIKTEILCDIEDRQKYLQMNQGAKKTLQEELDNLHYQVFRKLNRILENSDVDVIIKTADDLMQSMQDVEVPKSLREHKKTPPLTYQQKLKDMISQTLPEQENLSTDELAELEILKINLADAFINLQYFGGNTEQKNKLRRNINDEINKFCDNYLNHHPGVSLSVNKLNEDLYALLEKVPLPPDDTLYLIAEEVKFKDVINDWLKDLPLKVLNAVERLDTSNKAERLAKTLKDIERNDDKLLDQDVRQTMRSEITQFIKTLPLKPVQQKEIDSYLNRLLDMLGANERISRYDESRRYSIQIGDDSYESQLDYTQRDSGSYDKPHLDDNRRHLLCSLSLEDKQHLERIKQRTCMTPDCLSALLRNSNRDSSINPVAVENGSQTKLNFEYFAKHDNDTSAQMPGRPCQMPFITVKSVPPRVTIPSAQTGNQTDFQPQAIMKEYYWNTINSSKTDNNMACQAFHHPRPCSKRRGLIHESSSICPGARSTYSSCVQEELQTCQDKQSSPESFSQMHNVPTSRSPLHQSYNPIHHSSLRTRMSTDTSYIKNSNIDTTIFSSPSPEIRTRTDSLDRQSNKNIGEDWQQPFPRYGIMSGPIVEERDTCDNYKERYNKDSPDRHVRHNFQRDSGSSATCNNNSIKHWSTCCQQCIRCPYPSYLYFQE